MNTNRIRLLTVIPLLQRNRYRLDRQSLWRLVVSKPFLMIPCNSFLRERTCFFTKKCYTNLEDEVRFFFTKEANIQTSYSVRLL